MIAIFLYSICILIIFILLKKYTDIQNDQAINNIHKLTTYLMITFIISGALIEKCLHDLKKIIILFIAINISIFIIYLPFMYILFKNENILFHLYSFIKITIISLIFASVFLCTFYVFKSFIFNNKY